MRNVAVRLAVCVIAAAFAAKAAWSSSRVIEAEERAKARRSR